MNNHHRFFMQRVVLLVFLCLPVYQTTYAEENVEPNLAEKNYVSLQTELAHYQLIADKPWVTISETPKLKLKARNPNVGLLRERLQMTGDLSSDNTVTNKNIFDRNLAEGVKNFQTRHGLKSDGIAGVKTLEQLNISPQERIQAIQVNMQRWAELSKQLGNRFIMVNIPDFELYLYDDGKEVMSMKAIVGKPDWQTPELSSRISRIVLNPYWNVPAKIAANDLAPKVRKDPYYLQDMHIKVFLHDGDDAQEVDGNDIDWQNVDDIDQRYHFRQEPGDNNALGQVKFEFPNPYNVYLHDTSAKTLFNEDFRALSHGCVRLEKPLDLVAYLMKDNLDWSDQRTQDILDTKKTTYIPITKPIPVYITYITVWSDENGVVNYRDDIYKRDI